MPNGRNIIPRPEFAPEDMAWARGVQSDAAGIMDDIDSLKSNTIADYKQANAAATASLNQVSRIRNYVRSIPSTSVSSTGVSVSLPANTWTRVIDQEIAIPAGRNKFTIASTMNISLNTGSQNPSMWFSFAGGSGAAMESPLAGVFFTPESGSSYYARNAIAMNSINYVLPKTGGTARVTLSLWSSTAISATGTASLTYNLIAGGQA